MMKVPPVTRRIYLDPTGKNPPPARSLRISTERAFLEHALSNRDLYIHHDYLCKWAETFFSGRRQPVETLRSPSENLRALCPQLTTSEADHLLANISPLLDESELVDYAQKIFAGDWWARRVSEEHAARWLLWWLEHAPSPAERKLLAALADHYRHASRDAFTEAYEAQSQQEAENVLHAWLGYKPSNTSLGTFSPDLPDAFIRKLRDNFAERLLEEGVKLFGDLQGRGADERLLQIAAAETASYLQHNPAELSEANVRLLERYLTSGQSDMLRNSLPLTPPGAPPATFTELVTWFLEDYLPYRNHPKHDVGVVADIGRTFAERYLQLYLGALSGSPDKAYLSWQRTHQHDPNRATLIVVLDGLSVVDMKYFWRHFDEQNSGTYTLLTNHVALAALPSITEVAKPPLFYQRPPRDSRESHNKHAETVVPVLKKDDALRDALEQLKAGQALIWSLQEPDKNYHQYQQQETALAMAQGSIGGVVQRLTSILRQVPDSVPLDLVITTDHGRLLGESQRTLRAPEGMQAQGRAALGKSQQRFPETGYLIEDDVVYLHAGRFKLPTDAAMLISQDSFLTIDGKRGTLAYPHGGILPEEVLIPCWRIARSQAQVKVTATLQGSAEAGKRAALTLVVKNPNRIELRLQELILTDSRQVMLGRRASAMKESTHEVIIEGWFSDQEAREIKPSLRYQTPDGVVTQVSVKVNVDTQEMYTQDDILGDLL